MSLDLLKITNARNLKEYSLIPHRSYTILYGNNGVGKTTILESIYLLLRSRIFRSANYKSFINNNSSFCTVFSKFSHTNDGSLSSSFTLGISRSKDHPQPVLHLNSQKVNSLSSISNLVILALITPESFNLLDAGPAIRRKFLDWGVFHVEPSFLLQWKSYKKILANRNALLKNSVRQFSGTSRKLSSELLQNLEIWDSQLVTYNNSIDLFRSRQVDNIKPCFKKFLSLFSDELCENITIKYSQGWSNGISYKEYLKNKIREDLSAGYTRYGTHRSELTFTYKHLAAKDVLSRGQKKIIIICLILAQFNYLIQHEKTSEQNLLLLDDIDSELDKNNLEILFNILKLINSQVILTTTNNEKFYFLDKNDYNLFHVKQ